MSSEKFNCRVCNEFFKIRESWLCHLLSKDHQSEARKECLVWGSCEKLCTIVAYSSVSMKLAEKLLEYFSFEENGKICNFIWWPDRERIGLLLFESPEKVKNVFQAFCGTQLQLSDCVVDFKEAITCLDLEWSQLLHKDPAVDDHLPPLHNISLPELDIEPALLESTIQMNSSENKPMELLRNQASQAEEEPLEFNSSSKVVNSDSSSNDNDREDNVVRLDCGVILTECSYYASQFVHLYKSIEISKEIFKILDFIRTKLGQVYEVNMYRNWYLGFGISELHPVLIHGSHKNSDGIMEADNEVLQRRIMDAMEEEENLLKGYSVVEIESDKYIYSNPVTGVTFSVCTDALSIVEVQMCRLVEYFCSFDPRVRPFLGLVYYWARENCISFSASEGPSTKQEYSNVPGPAGLDWLVILFLCKSGILPTVREILKRPHKQVIILDEYGDSHDIGFNADPDFSREWKEKSSSISSYNGQLEKELSNKFTFDLLTLMRDFVIFLLSIKDGDWVLNPKDTEIYEMDKFLKDEPGTIWSTKLSNDEVYRIRYHNDRNQFYIQESQMTLMHPLLATWRISLSPKMFSSVATTVMKRTRFFLGRFFDSLKKKPNELQKLTFLLAHNSKRLLEKKRKRGEKRRKQREQISRENDNDDASYSKRQNLNLSNQSNVSIEDGNTSKMYEEELEVTESQECHFQENDNVTEALPEIKDSSENVCKDLVKFDCEVKIGPCSPLLSQFLRMLKSVEISEQKLKILDFIRKTLGDEYEVNMYRNWYLNLGISKLDTLLVHVHIKQPDSLDGFMEANLGDVKRKLRKCVGKEKVLLGFKSQEAKSYAKVCFYSNPVSGMSFCVLTNDKVMLEVQTCRLVKYFCNFDPRVRPLLGLVYYWARENYVCISPNRGLKEWYRGPPALDWLVIVYLCKSGVIPSVREVMERPHKPTLVYDDDNMKHDVGFDDDPAFAEEWRRKREPLPYEGYLDTDFSDKFVQDILSLMRDFIEFVCTLKNGRWVINPKDAEVYDHNHFWNDAPGTTWNTKMTNDEILKKRLHGNKDEAKPRQENLTFLHPLMLTKRISISQNMLVENRSAGEVLKQTSYFLQSFFTKLKERPEKCSNLRKFLVHVGKISKQKEWKKKRRTERKINSIKTQNYSGETQEFVSNNDDAVEHFSKEDGIKMDFTADEPLHSEFTGQNGLSFETSTDATEPIEVCE